MGLAGEAVTDPVKGVLQIQSDFFAVANGFVSITPIQIPATNYEILNSLKSQFIQKDF